MLSINHGTSGVSYVLKGSNPFPLTECLHIEYSVSGCRKLVDGWIKWMWVMVRVFHYLRCCKDVCKELGLLTVEELVRLQYSSPNIIERM